MDAWIQGIEQIWAASTKIKTRKVILYTPPLSQNPKVIRPLTFGLLLNLYTSKYFCFQTILPLPTLLGEVWTPLHCNLLSNKLAIALMAFLTYSKLILRHYLR